MQRTKRKKAKKPAARIKPWPNCTFALRTKWEDWGESRHFRVHLERRSPGKYGRLELMHAIVPKRKHKIDVERLFASAKYRARVLEHAAELMEQAGVPAGRAREFFSIIEKEYPAPTREELFLDELEQPLIKLALGDRRNELSYFKTGLAELTREDARLVKSCIDHLFRSAQGNQARTAALMKLFW